MKEVWNGEQILLTSTEMVNVLVIKITARDPYQTLTGCYGMI